MKHLLHENWKSKATSLDLKGNLLYMLSTLRVLEFNKEFHIEKREAQGKQGLKRP